MKKLIFLGLVVALFFVIFLFVYYGPKDYETSYKLNGISITESYIKNDEVYHFVLKEDDYSYEMAVKSEYINKRKLIKSIQNISLNNYNCLVSDSDYLNVYLLCKNENGNLSYHQVEGLETKIDKKFYPKIDYEESEYNKTAINYLNDKIFLLWNYSGFDQIGSKIKNRKNVIKYDIYEIPLATQVNEYIVIPDYSNEFYFNKVYIYNIKTSMVKEWNLDFDIYFDSYVLGTYNNSIFIVDRKQSKEYELVPHKEKIRKLNGKILEHGEWEDITMDKLIHTDYAFSSAFEVQYTIINERLYKTIGNYQELISNQKVTSIVKSDVDEVYYLVEDKLYMYNSLKGEILLLTNFEWYFNYDNLIFIY